MGELQKEPALFHFQVKQRQSVGERIAERPVAGNRHLRRARLTFPLCIVSNTAVCCSSKTVAAAAKPARPAMFPANTSRTLFYLSQCFSFASASGKFEQRRVRVVAFGLAVSIFPLCQPAHGDASGVTSGPVTLTARVYNRARSGFRTTNVSSFGRRRRDAAHSRGARRERRSDRNDIFAGARLCGLLS